MIVYRIGKEKFINDLSGEGARLYGGRWNYVGYPVLYTSESIPLAILEYIIKTGITENKISNLKIAYLEIKNNVTVSAVNTKSLSDEWNSYPALDELRKIGTNWILSLQSLILRVPAVSAPDSQNILINPAHHEIKYVKSKKIIDYNPDVRLGGSDN